jgi:sigma-B regulation protein RsbU (phosphoserine phosphatase)
MSDEGVAASAGARLLVVDDNEDNRYTLILRLEIEGYENIAVADDGETALEMMRTQEFDLVLLDVMMPKVDGYQVLQRLKAEGRLHNIPVIMISALTEIDSVVRCISLGAEDYLPKPFDPVLLKARVGASLEKKRLRDEVRAHLARMEEELEAGRQLQMSMVPASFPQPTEECPLEIFAMMQPAREVGGDLYDFYDIDADTKGFFIGDVSGKGVASALFMARTKNILRLLSRLLRRPDGAISAPGEVMTALNRELCQDNASMMFVTLFFGTMNPATGALRYCSAGHNPPYRLTGSGLQTLSDGKGRPLGVRPDSVYQTATVKFDPDDILYLYTDGITEAHNQAGELFSEERLEQILHGARGSRSEDILNAVSSAVTSFANGAPQSDDITAMAIRFLHPPV